jgi:signal transduction histidine kinase
VTAVGTGLTALGLVTTQALSADAAARAAALLSVGAALVAIMLALVYLTLRVRKVNSQDLVQVESWYGNEFRRTWLAMAASWLLVVAVGLGGAAGLRAAVAGGRGSQRPQLTLEVAGTGRERTVTASATIANLRAGAVVSLRLTGMRANAAPVPLLESRTTVSETGTATLSPEATKVASYAHYRAALLVDGRERSSLTIP